MDYHSNAPDDFPVEGTPVWGLVLALGDVALRHARAAARHSKSPIDVTANESLVPGCRKATQR